ncbi:MAG: hypothetical protein IPG66_05935 [Hydrogenophilales bacterium]|nr:hypothetical protein [Hydrogenophilales bacterium]
MSRDLSTAFIAAGQARVADPAYLIEIVWSATLTSRFSSRGDQSWNGVTWQSGRVAKFQPLPWDGAGGRGRLDLLNADYLIGAIVGNQVCSDVPVRAWIFYGDDPAVGDVLRLPDAAIDSVPDIGAIVRLDLAADNMGMLYSPRQWIGPGVGVNHVDPPGTVIHWGEQRMVIGSEGR